MNDRELRCFVCDRRAPPGSVGWESDEVRFHSHRDLCPKHRQDRPRAMATLGELVNAHREKLRAAR